MEHSEDILNLIEQKRAFATSCDNISKRLEDPILAGLPASIELGRCIEDLTPLMESGRNQLNVMKERKQNLLDRLEVDEMFINITKRSLIEFMEEVAHERGNFQAGMETWQASKRGVLNVRFPVFLKFQCS